MCFLLTETVIKGQLRQRLPQEMSDVENLSRKLPLQSRYLRG